MANRHIDPVSGLLQGLADRIDDSGRMDFAGQAGLFTHRQGAAFGVFEEGFQCANPSGTCL